ncbi:hypothetical protein [Lysobacter solisilvae (ex Woo and Kim 2020)]|uniref:Uncharacterized protein n=1 Tax=Agrilutibacter terrestris TaxID=2865112 RepID=A0A7H0FZN0_9GAMM|nr:hypothetical protein [Lysobacter terrestris]QNP41496.1 hypothetical protein H8B22_04575 [Lysobacter terrestris]
MHTYAKLKRRLLALALAFSGLVGFNASAQDFTVGWNPRSGDVWVDTWLGDMNRYGGRYPEPFIDEMVRYHNAPRALVVDLLQTRHWAPGDVYYACALASVLGRPCRYVVDVYEADRGQGWGVIAQRMGIKPGSAEFHRLKKGFVPTYDRWARPIELDADLRRDFPNHGKGQHGGKGKASASGGGKPAKATPASASGKGKQGSGGPNTKGGKGAGRGQNSGKKGNGKG